MKPLQIFHSEDKSIDDPVECIGIFLLVLGLLLFPLKLKYIDLWQVMYGYLFFTGWFSWTFVEYMFHRFAWHSKQGNKGNSQSDTFNHLYHHQHPTEIRMTNVARSLLVIGSLLLVFASIWFRNYVTIAVGFVCGFTIYNLTHWLLHKKLTQKIFPKKVRYHIYHHCKYPDKCFGISVTWWDDIFGTVPSQGDAISPKVIDFYFGEKKHRSATTVKKGLIILIILFTSHFYSSAQERILQYDVTRNGSVIGYVNITQKTKENIVILELKSEVKARFIVSYTNYIKESVAFENGSMVYASYYQKENGKETIKTIAWDGKYCRMENNGHIDSQIYSPVHTNYIQLFSHIPNTLTKIYSSHYQRFLGLKKVAENKYRLILPDGNCNYYYYKNGVCDRVDIERTFFTIHFILRKNQKK